MRAGRRESDHDVTIDEKYIVVQANNVAQKMPKFHSYEDCPNLHQLLAMDGRKVETLDAWICDRLRMSECTACARRTKRAQVGVTALRDAIAEIDENEPFRAREILVDLLQAFEEIEREE